jgi:D-arabinose 1-dehydrogenase-like Zn-dependent alcohol dehydrogenase
VFEKIKQVFESLTGGRLLWLNAFISYCTQTVMSTTQVSSESCSQYKAKAYAAASAESPLAPMTIPRRDPDEHDINAYIQLLRRDGNITLVGAPDKPHAVSALSLLFKRRSLSGSLIGGISETQEMLDFCGKHNITANVEVIPIQKVNEAYERMSSADVKYRFSIDMASLKSQ